MAFGFRLGIIYFKKTAVSLFTTDNYIDAQGQFLLQRAGLWKLKQYEVRVTLTFPLFLQEFLKG